MKFVRKHKTFSIAVLCLLVLFLGITIVFGRYIHNIINNFILETKAFYFNSSILNINGKNYSIVNWDGVNSYNLTIDLNNRKNDLKHTLTDITYNISVNCPDTVVCTLSKESGIIRPEDETDSYVITVTPIQNFYEGDSVRVTTSVTSTLPYQKTMSATYTIGVEKSDFSYEIVDSVNSKYLTLNLTNSITYYQVSQAFGSYAVGDQVSLEDYATLSDTDKNKCFSAIVTVTYDPHILYVDMTDNLYLHRLSTNYQEQTINGYQYVSKFSFKVNASSNNALIFYKEDITQNYTYPIVNNNSIIQVSVQKAN